MKDSCRLTLLQVNCQHAGVGSVDSVDDSGVGKAACVVMYDPWYPAIPCESPARSQWLSGCPSLVLGSVSFNTESEKGIIYAEGEDVGLQVHSLLAPTVC